MKKIDKLIDLLLEKVETDPELKAAALAAKAEYANFNPLQKVQLVQKVKNAAEKAGLKI